ncbi:MAG TPA: hypothetical protein V6D22_15835 [Candidatus Obscuribacterales bacterium]
MPQGHGITHLLHKLYPLALPFVQWLVVICICASAYLIVGELFRTRLPQAAKLALSVFTAALASSVSALVVLLPPLLVAKLALIVGLIGGGCFCLIMSRQAGRFYRTLAGIQQECELATNLTFLQGEITRAQLEQISQKLRQASEPQEKEITETMLKSLSPIVMLYLRKEKSLVEWSMAAANLGRTLLKYFWSPSSSSNKT